MKIKFCVALFFIVALAQGVSAGLLQNIFGIGVNPSQIVQDNHATFPLCFPSGFPGQYYPYACYNLASFPNAYRGPLPCLPPIIQGRAVIPCEGNYVTISNYRSGAAF